MQNSSLCFYLCYSNETFDKNLTSENCFLIVVKLPGLQVAFRKVISPVLVSVQKFKQAIFFFFHSLLYIILFFYSIAHELKH